ncbi:hypothetical protein [Bartonella kosoyi]|uniref:hypothetical protein n=1 Tax=Bartonella kosoyi TaxID=2133959 RepID=UPI001FCE9683|nr:hypothetical protein [Bartonella kosoyi]
MVISAFAWSSGVFAPEVSPILPAVSIEATISVLFPESMATPLPPDMSDQHTDL